MKFRLVNIGPTKDAEIELGDLTFSSAILQMISHFALKSIYTSLVLWVEGMKNTLSKNSIMI